MVAMNLGELHLKGWLSPQSLPVTGRPHLLYLYLAVEGGQMGAPVPVNLALVLDVSESMFIRLASSAQFQDLVRQGIVKEVLVDGVPAWESTGVPAAVTEKLVRKVDRVKEALRAVVEQLRPTDRFAVVAFASEAISLIPNSPGRDSARLLHAVARLDTLKLGDATHIGAGMELGLRELAKATEEGLVDRMVVLTDGFTVDEAACWAQAEAARQARIPISTIGLGGDFNEELMIPIADSTGGEAYMVRHADDLPAAFAQELQRTQSVRYRNLALNLHIVEGAELRSAYRVRPTLAPLETRQVDPGLTLDLGDVAADEAPALLLEVLAPPRSEGMYRIARAALAYDDLAAGGRVRGGYVDLAVSYANIDDRASQHVPEVMNALEAVTAYRLQEGAGEALKTGDLSGASRKLRSAATRLLAMGQDELAAEMQEQASQIEREGRADAERARALRYATRKLGQD